MRDGLKARSLRGNFSFPENLHLTLVFIGECDGRQASTIKSIMDEIIFSPIEIVIDKAGLFQRSGGDIRWAGVRENIELTGLQRSLSEKISAAGFEIDARKYSPHVTLGREVVLSRSGEDAPFEPFGETVSRIDLMKSERVNGKLTYAAIYGRDSV